MTAFPEMFKCGGFMNGGMSGQNTWERKDEYQNSGKTPEQLYQHTKQNMLDLADQGLIGDQDGLRDSAVYIFGGMQDTAVPIHGPQEQRHYFQDMGAQVSYTIDPNFGHNYPEATIAGDVSNWCYTKRSRFSGMGG